MHKKIYVIAAVLFSLILVLGFWGLWEKRQTDLPLVELPIKKPRGKAQTTDIPRLSVVASNLEIPWSLTFLPNGNFLFTERPGRVKMIELEKNLAIDVVALLEDVKHIGEGGLLSLALHPEFEQNQFIYLYYTYSSDSAATFNRVVRFKFDNKNLSDPKIVVDRIPSASNHNGGRIKFGPDGFLYITTGDAQDPSLAQDQDSLAGKILRVTDEGKPVADNPFNNLVYSYGHRNAQGLAWDDQGRLWSTEHGQRANDELNLIEKGGNYGWPEIQGDEEKEGMTTPVVESGKTTWAPAGLAYLEDSLFFAGLSGSTLYQFDLENTSLAKLKEHLKDELGRIRDVVVGPDGMLYITTSNRDGRGLPALDDDKILRVNPDKL